MNSIHLLQQTAAAMLVSRDITAHGAAAAAEHVVRQQQPNSRRAGGPMVADEYKVVQNGDVASLEKVLNASAADGWEVLSTTSVATGIWPFNATAVVVVLRRTRRGTAEPARVQASPG
jgi:hypothetical protein